MRKFSIHDIVRFKGKSFTVEVVDEEGKFHIVPLSISKKADTDESLEMSEQYFNSMICVTERELELVKSVS